MNPNELMTMQLTRREWLVVADALVARRREGVARQRSATIKLELGVGMQMAEDADAVLTKIGTQELTQLPISGAEAEATMSRLLATGRQMVDADASKSGLVGREVAA